jgi:large subunit ribosomal protein L18
MKTGRYLKIEGRERRHKRIRKKIVGTAARPRLSVYKSVKHMYAQIIDDIKANTILSVSTLSPDLKGKVKTGGNVASAALLGDLVGEKALAKGVKEVVFDRAGYKYHGRVKALADAARKKGLVF